MLEDKIEEYRLTSDLNDIFRNLEEQTRESLIKELDSILNISQLQCLKSRYQAIATKMAQVDPEELKLVEWETEDNDTGVTHKLIFERRNN